jgi:DNA-binding LacI/PurR family transcriptional regulator
MIKKLTNTMKRDVRRAATIKDTKEIVGVSTSTIQKVLRGERTNDKVVMVFMELTERKSALIEAVKELVKFD